MSILALLYWVILVLAVIGALVPATLWPHPFLGSLPLLVLFILIGLKIFRTPIQ